MYVTNANRLWPFVGYRWNMVINIPALHVQVQGMYVYTQSQSVSMYIRMSYDSITVICSMV